MSAFKHDTILSIDSISLPERNWTTSYVQHERLAKQLSNVETYSTQFTDVSLFNDSESDVDDTAEYTLAIIKPTATRHMYKIESFMTDKCFIIKKVPSRKDVFHLKKEEAAHFYRSHKFELYYSNLVEHMTSGPIIVYVLMKSDCIADWKRCIGPADVAYAKQYEPFTLRAIYGKDSGNWSVTNGFHGSSSRRAAEKEILFFFPYSKPKTISTPINNTLEFIHAVMMPTITKGIVELYKAEPVDPLRWFGKWLLLNNLTTAKLEA
ncbi:nucleoside diphosphate kinase homolog 5-like [Adelges cooleyi]|uniref:nucleoside diphosphate kinase homolog 5-like n=1 Tax=Adelges cooleyi TaxID=133065 RepID=UPI00217F5EE5|nr:nucleoside diphosphate kinase homolog 5-like [Adelges cooleyi]